MKKQVTILEGINTESQTNGRCTSGDMSLDEVLKVFPDFVNGALTSLFSTSAVNHIVIVIYRNSQGDEKRRIAAYPQKTSSDKQMIKAMSQVAATLGIKLDRTLIILKGGRK